MSALCDLDGTAPAVWYIAVVNRDGVRAELQSRWSCTDPEHLAQARAVVGTGGREYTVTELGAGSSFQGGTGDIPLAAAEKFEKFDRENPAVYATLCRLARTWINGTGRRQIGIGALTERCRWEIALATNDPEFKINNNFRAYYARKIMRNEPDLSDVFELRRSAADEWMAVAS